MSWNSEPSTDLARFSKVGQHNECLGILFPDHSPQILDGGRVGTCKQR